MQVKTQNSPYFTATYREDHSSPPGLRRLAFLMALKCLSLSLRWRER